MTGGRRVPTLLCTLLLAAASVLLFAAPGALAAPPAPVYGSWTFAGSTGAYTGSVDLAPGFPAISLTSDSLTPPDPPVASGASAWLPTGSPVGAVYGSSQNKQYVNLRPRANGAGSPSTTTYRFAAPTPVGSWSMILGDIDAEVLTVTGSGAAGPVAGAALGVHPAFNYCDASPRASTCSGLAAPYPTPTVSVGAAGVTASDPLCPPTDCNTTGAAIWLEPSVPLTSLTVTSTWRQGFPSYQTWFATRTAAVTGSVTSACPSARAPVARLLGAGGTALATAPVSASGEYSFAAVAAGGDYTVDLDPATLPAGATAGTASVTGVTGEVAAAPLTVTSHVDVDGSVTGPGAAGAGVVLTPTAPAGPPIDTTAGPGGAYAFAAVAPGAYTVTVDAAGSVVTPPSRDVTVGCDAVTVDPFDLAASTTPPTSTPPTTGTTTPGSPTSATPTSATPTVGTGAPSTGATASSSTAGSSGVAGAGGGSSAAAGTGSLAATGVAIGVPAAGGVGLVTLGLLLLTPRRRRRH